MWYSYSVPYRVLYPINLSNSLMTYLKPSLCETNTKKYSPFFGLVVIQSIDNIYNNPYDISYVIPSPKTLNPGAIWPSHIIFVHIVIRRILTINMILDSPSKKNISLMFSLSLWYNNKWIVFIIKRKKIKKMVLVEHKNQCHLSSLTPWLPYFSFRYFSRYLFFWWCFFPIFFSLAFWQAINLIFIEKVYFLFFFCVRDFGLFFGMCLL